MRHLSESCFAPSRFALVALAAVTLFLSGLAAGPVAGQEPSPYAGDETREIKALSPQDVAGYLEGRGMGLARAAELNHYPGPKHVLELAEALDLSADQQRRSEEIYAVMNAEAVRLGHELVAAEAELDGAFAAGEIEAGELAARLTAIAELAGRLRLAHLGAHLEQRRALSPEQVRLYDELRGYGAGADEHGAGGGAGHHHGHAGHGANAAAGVAGGAGDRRLPGAGG